MVLNPQASYPSARSYVLKLHRDARPQRGLLCGRLEHIVSGASIDFPSSDALLAWLLALSPAVQTTPADPQETP